MNDSLNTQSDIGKGGLLMYQSTECNIKLDIRSEQETVGLSQDQMATLFGKAPNTITGQILNIFKEGELNEDAECWKFRLTTQHPA